ncbi:MAG: hypothetical protein WBY88_05555, partial [Desulfosarcina sp.]
MGLDRYWVLCDRHIRLRASALLVVGLVLVLVGCSSDQPTETPVVEAQSSAPAYTGTIVAVGNSLTAGLGVAEDQAYP